MNRCMRHHHNDTTGTDHRCQLADGHTGPHADPELRTSTRSPRGVHSMQWDDDGTEVPHTEHVHTAPRLVDTDGVGVTYQPPSVPAEPPAAVLPPIDMPRNPYIDVDPPAYPDVTDHVQRLMVDEQHRMLGKLVADVAERRDHTTQIGGVLIAPCDSRGNLVPILADDDTVAAPPELRDADRQPPAELRERVLDNIPITTEYANARPGATTGAASCTRPPVDAHLIDDINRLALAYASARDDHTAMREIVKRLTSQLADAYAALAAQQELLDHSAYREEQIASIITNHFGRQPPAELRERVLDNIPITTEYANALLAGHHPIDRVDEATTIIDLLADEADQQRIRAEAAEAERDELDR